MKNSKAKLNALDYPVTYQEVRKKDKKLKNKKAASSYLIKNEMLKASYEILMNVYIKLFNLVLDTGIYPSFRCDGLITIIFKTGDKSDPGNYRDICVSSYLGKLFSSILTHRLLDFADNNNLLHPSQIGFFKNNRTSDHILTLRALIEKYLLHYTNKKCTHVSSILKSHLIVSGMKAYSIVYQLMVSGVKSMI